MPRRLSILVMLCSLAASATIVDRVAVIVGPHVVKSSDIERDIRVVNFINGEPLDFSLAARKKAASRLIDQEMIRQEIRAGGYPIATSNETGQMLDHLRKEHGGEAGFERALGAYGITSDELRSQLAWQMTALRFIDARFRPGVVVSEEEMNDYYRTHRAELMKAYPSARGLDDLRPHIEDAIAGERVNKAFYDWLAERRKEVRVEYREDDLK